MSNWEDRFEQKPRRTGFNVGLSVVMIVIAIGAIASAAVWGLNLLSQPAAVVSKTLDAGNMIAVYENFRTQYADIKAMPGKIDNAKAALAAFEKSVGPDRSAWKSADRDEWNRLSSIVLGLQNKRLQMIADYNGDASKANQSFLINPPMTGGEVLPTHIEP